MENQVNEKQALKEKIMTITGIVLCAILVPLLIINIIMIINSYVNKDEAPSIGQYVPFIVKSESMKGTIEGGDIIITKKVKPEDVEEGDIISFYDPKGSGTSVVTHRVLWKKVENGKIVFTTIGDVKLQEKIEKYGSIENIPDDVTDVEVVPAENVISEYVFRIGFIGKVSLFMSTVPGFIVCVLVPLLLFLGYDILRTRITNKANEQDAKALLAEIEMLRAQKEALEKEKENKEEGK